MSIESPEAGARLTSVAVDISIDVARGTTPDTFRVTLDGVDITKRFQTGECRNSGCIESAQITAADGLYPGTHRLRASIKAHGHGQDTRREQFVWAKSQFGTPLTEMSPTYGFTTVTSGGSSDPSKPWISIYSNALRGGTVTFPSSSDTPCTTVYQILLLDRRSLTEEGYSCYDTDAEFTAALGFPDDAQNGSEYLVIAGTTAGKVAGTNLDTRPIGGSVYPFAILYLEHNAPQEYMIVGTGGAAAGQAFESYNVYSPLESGAAYQPQITGLLAVDAYSRYNFHPSDNTLYSVNWASPGQPYITVGQRTYYNLSSLNNGGFWLLRLNRLTLQDADAGSDHCWSLENAYHECGLFFDTGNPDGLIALLQTEGLAQSLGSSSPRDLLFLVSTGPGGPIIPGSNVLGVELDVLGASGYTLMNLSSDSNYALISCADEGYPKSMSAGNVVVSTTAYSAQQQTGYVYGVLSRDGHALFRPANTVQDKATNATPGDESFFTIPWTRPQPWPHMGTAAEQGAYRYLSYSILNDKNVYPVMPNVNADDVRYLYTDPVNNGKLFSVSPAAYPMPGSLPWVDPVDQTSYTFTSGDLSTVATQLKTEFGDLSTAVPYLGNAGIGQGLGGALMSDDGGIALSLIGSVADVLKDVNVSESTQVSANISNIMNLVAGSLTIAAGLADPGLAPTLTVASGAFWDAASLGLVNHVTSGIPGQDYAILTTAGDLAQNYATYLSNAPQAYDILLDNIYTDFTKLDMVAQKVQGPWRLPDEDSLDGIKPALTQAANSSFYLQLLPAAYSVDYWYSWPTVSSPASLVDPITGFCESTYNSVAEDTNAWQIYLNYFNLGYSDIYVIGGEIHSNHSSSMYEDFPSTPLDANRLWFWNRGSELPARSVLFSLGPTFPQNTARSGPLL